jgi:hypothetical protein
MPFTPFHFGPGALIKAVFPKYFSLIVFVLVQVIIDCETLYHLLKHEQPLHQLLHTYLGSNLAVIAAVFVYRPLHNFFIGELTFEATLISAIIGAYSHVFLDSIMHLDVKPWVPFRSTNTMWHIIEVGHLHLLCIYCGLAGIGILILRAIFSKSK